MSAPAAPFWLSVLRLCRIGTWFSPAADVLASSCLVGLAFGADVARAMLASVLLYGAGMVWNDIADRAEDARQRPERPLPSGAIGIGFAVGLGLLLLLAGLSLSPCRSHHLILLVLVLFYDFLGKRAALLGAATMGLLRGLNLWTGAAMAAVTVTDAHALPLLVASLCYGIYIFAVTVLGIYEDTPSVSGRAVAGVQSVPPLIALLAIGYAQGGFWPAPALAAVPALWFLRRNARRADWPQHEIRISMRHLLLGTMLFTALLALAKDRPVAAAAIAGAIVPARLIARRIALT